MTTPVNILWGPQSGRPLSGGANTNTNLTTAAKATSTYFQATRTENLTQVGVYCANTVGNPPPYRIAVLNPKADADPDYTSPVGSIETVDFTDAGWYWVTLSTPAALTRGNWYHVTLWPGDVAPDASNYATVWRQSYTKGAEPPFAMDIGTTVWSSPNAGLQHGAMWWDGVIELPAITGRTVSLQSDTDPDEAGAVFTLPFACTVKALVWSSRGSTTSADYRLRLYDGDGTTVLRSLDIDPGEIRDTTSNFTKVWPITPLALAKDTTYRLTLTSLHNSYSVDPTILTLNEAASRLYWPEGDRWQGTSRTDLGEWTDNPLQIPMMGLWLSSIEESAGPAGTTRNPRRPLLGVGI